MNIPHAVKSLKTPFGRIMVTRDKGESGLFASQVFATNLNAVHLGPDGHVIKEYDLGSGLVTTAGVRLLSLDTAVTAGAAALSVVKYHGVGTGSTAAAVGDTALQTPIGSTATLGVNTNASASPNATFTSTATVTPGAAAVTEWILCNSATLAGATVWDHKIFGAITTGVSDSIIFSYVCTLTAGS